MKIIAVIPARFASTRFPGKPLVDIHGKSMVQRVYEQVQLVEKIDKILVATDDERIFDYVTNFGGEAIMTDSDLPSGTERCAAAVNALNEDFDIVINVQGDEPFIAPELITQVINGFNDGASIVTAAKNISDNKTLFNTNVVKVVFSTSGRALYFSRQAIPFLRDVAPEMWLDSTPFYKHIGIYGFRTAVLNELVKLPEEQLESNEKLEQLRWLYHDHAIKIVVTEHESVGIDTPEDLSKIMTIWK